MLFNIFKSIIPTNSTGPILELIDLASVAIEVLAVVIIIVPLVFTTAKYVYTKFKPVPEEERYYSFRTSLGRSLLVGLEVLIAADVIRTVALEATFESVAILGMLVLIRTFLSWSLVVEIEGHWPWQGQKEA